MIIGITGGTGLVGTHLTRLLTGNGMDVVILTRNVGNRPTHKGVTYAHCNARKGTCDINALKKLDAVVNLAGAGIADKRWTQKRKKEIVSSRVNGTEFLVSMLQEHAPNCKTFIGASAVGYYGPDRGHTHPFTETDPPYQDFLSDTCVQWEAASLLANDLMRTVILRFGIVLGKEGGAFPQLSGPMNLGAVPIMGNGGQIVSWIAATDLARLIAYALTHKEMHGIYNAVSPYPVTHRQMMSTIAAAKGGIKIPVHIPSSLLHMLLGELSIELLKSCTVSADKVTAAGFTFQYPYIGDIIKELAKK